MPARKRAAGDVIVRPDGRLWFDFSVEAPDGRRERIRRNPKATTLKDAQKEANAIRARYAHAAINGEVKGSRPFAEAVEKYLEFQQRGSGDTERLLKISQALGNIKLRDVTQDELERLRKVMLKPGHKTPQPSIAAS